MTASLTNRDGTPQIVRYVDQHGLERIATDTDSLVRYASQALRFAENGLFELLPAALDRIIERKGWKDRDPPLKDFGQLALHPSGLGIANDRSLALLRAAMDVTGRHVGPWADVLAAVEQSVKTLVVESEHSTAYIRKHPDQFRDRVTYTPRVTSLDHRLLDLRRKHAVTFRQVISGKKALRQALQETSQRPQPSRVTRMKSAWKGASEKERREFLAWLNQHDNEQS